MHSDSDSIIPVHHGRKNFEAANEPRMFQTLSGDHNDTFTTDRGAVAKGIHEFLKLLDAERKEVADNFLSEPNAPDAEDKETGR